MPFPAFSLLDQPPNFEGIESAKAPAMQTSYFPNHVPLNVAMTATPILASLLLLPAAVVVAGPSTADQYSLLGALCGLVIVLVSIRKTDSSLPNSIAALAGTMIAGVACPGAFVQWLIWKGHLDETTHPLTWHSWCLLGFVSSLLGWATAQALYQSGVRLVPTLIEWLISKITKNKT